MFSLSHLVIAQENVGSKIFSKEEIEQLFPDSIKEKFNIQYPIRRVFSYNDDLGDYLIALSESIDGVVDRDTLHHAIKAFHFKRIGNQLKKVREINDYVTKNDYTEEKESSIWFWTRYSQCKDIDNDGLVEPVIIYGSKPENFDSFRVKILIYYKGKKYAIRHNNCSLDFCRFTQIDKEFYTLPQNIKEHIKNIIREIEKNNHAYFGHWEDAMENRKEKF